MTVSMIVLSTLLLASTAIADDDSSRAKLMGKWPGDGDTMDLETIPIAPAGKGSFAKRPVCPRHVVPLSRIPSTAGAR